MRSLLTVFIGWMFLFYLIFSIYLWGDGQENRALFYLGVSIVMLVIFQCDLIRHDIRERK